MFRVLQNLIYPWFWWKRKHLLIDSVESSRVCSLSLTILQTGSILIFVARRGCEYSLWNTQVMSCSLVLRFIVPYIDLNAFSICFRLICYFTLLYQWGLIIDMNRFLETFDLVFSLSLVLIVLFVWAFFHRCRCRILPCIHEILCIIQSTFVCGTICWPNNILVQWYLRIRDNLRTSSDSMILMHYVVENDSAINLFLDFV